MTPAITPRLIAVLVAGAAAVTIGYELRDREPMVDLVLPEPWHPPVLELTGNRAFTSAEVRAEIPALVDQEALERGLLLVSAFYWDRGYANVKVGEPAIGERAVVVPVEEGPMFTMGKVVAPEMSLVKTRPGMVFSRIGIATDHEALQTFYEDQSYAFANVVPQVSVDLDRKEIALTFEIELGPKASFERIDVLGSPAREAEIRRALTIAAGQPFNATRLADSKARVEALGFNDVVISTNRGSNSALVVATIEVVD